MLKLDTGGRLDKGLGRGSRPPEEVRFAIDSALEGDGFELPVPMRQAKLDAILPVKDRPR